VDAPLDSGLRSVLRLAWPSVLSFVLNNGYRINDQYWVQGLGPDAHAAIAASTFVLILNFAVIFVAVGGCMPLVARAAGAADRAERDHVVRHGLVLGAVIAVLLGGVGWLVSPHLAQPLGAQGAVVPLVGEYLRAMYLGIPALVLAPLLDGVFLGLGNTRLPMLLQGGAVLVNLGLNPLLIYGVGGWEGMGIGGAAVATCLSRAAAAGAGLVFLRRLYGIRLGAPFELDRERLASILRLGAPSALSIAVYAGVYVLLFGLVIGQLGRDVVAGFGIGFNAFESISYPFFLGIALAGSSLVGRNLGAGRPDEAWRAVRHVRLLGRIVGLAFALAFWFGGSLVAPLFSDDPGVLDEVVLYVVILGWSQLLVSEETVNEKVLYGAGHPRSIFWISSLGNLLRIPLAWWLALELGWGAAGVWWAINLTTFLKGGLFYAQVQRGRWTAAVGGGPSS